MPEASPKSPRRPSKNIDWVEFPELTWKSDGDVANALASLYKHAEARAEATVAWYMREKESKSLGSRTLRLLAIFLGTLGGLAPVLGSSGLVAGFLPAGAEVTEIGFLLLGLAAACVAVDKLFGLSSAWMRYILTAMEIQEDLSQLRLDWAAMNVRSRSRPLSTGDILALLERLRRFLAALDGRVMQETRAWIAEFQTNLADIDRAASEMRVQGSGRAEGHVAPPPARERMSDAPVVDTRVDAPAVDTRADAPPPAPTGGAAAPPAPAAAATGPDAPA